VCVWRSCPSVEAAQKWAAVLQEQCRKARRRKGQRPLPTTPAARTPHTPHTPGDNESVLSVPESLVAPDSERWQTQVRTQ
jgi:hypothetical protein